MVEVDSLKKILSIITSEHDYTLDDYEAAPAALPDSSIHFLISICKQLNIKKVVEFGSGRSTKALLQIGCSVTSIEDTHYWMQQTLTTLTEIEKTNHRQIVAPLKMCFVGFIPFMDWRLSNILKHNLKEAEMILIDSPFYAPFRESTLWNSLKYSKGSIVILDDTRIYTLAHFCNSIANSNKSILHERVMVGHTFDLFYRGYSKKIHKHHTLWDILKGWRRFFLGIFFYYKLSKKNKSDF